MSVPEQEIRFQDLGLPPDQIKALVELGFETPTAIQVKCIPHLLAGRDVLGQAQTGTGKTAAFSLPLLCRIDLSLKAPQILVLTPTRELALQVAEAIQSYASKQPGFQILPIYGGQGYTQQLNRLKRNPQVIVGTPGRIMDHIRRGSLSLEHIKALVLDEADEMLNMGFADDIEWIFSKAPEERQVALFSATMPPAIRRVAQEHLRNPVEVKIAAATQTVDTIDQSHVIVTHHNKFNLLVRIIELENTDGMIVFVRTRNETVEVADRLKAYGFTAEALNGDMNQEMRERMVDRLKQGALDILVATDVAARGLDVERISHVVNYDIPTDPSAYVHRIGRTGRAGRSGRAILLVEPRESGLLRSIERTIGRKIPTMEPPSAAALSASRIDRFTEQLRQTLAEQDLDFFYRLVSRISKEKEMEVLDIAAALAYLAQRERPLQVKDEIPVRKITARDPERPFKRRLGELRKRDPRDDHGRRPAVRDSHREHAGDLVSYRIEVGREHGVMPGEIVGAIANESGLSGRQIGRINIRDGYSLVDLPAGMPPDIFTHLQRVYVRGRQLRISVHQGDNHQEKGGRGKGADRKYERSEA